MKGRVMIVGASFVLLALVQIGGWAQAKYHAKQNEELYGTWITDKSVNSYHVQKVAYFAGGWKDFNNIGDTDPYDSGTMKIDKKWTDSDGNTWYETFHMITTGGSDRKGYKLEVLHKISQSGMVKESVRTLVGAFDPTLYPTEIDPKDDTYQIFYRPTQ